MKIVLVRGWPLLETNKALVCLGKFFRLRSLIYDSRANRGHTLFFVACMFMVIPFRNGSVFDVFKVTVTLSLLIKTSVKHKLSFSEKSSLTVNSPHLKNPKKAKVQHDFMRASSNLPKQPLSKYSTILFNISMSIGRRLGWFCGWLLLTDFKNVGNTGIKWRLDTVT